LQSYAQTDLLSDVCAVHQAFRQAIYAAIHLRDPQTSVIALAAHIEKTVADDRICA